MNKAIFIDKDGTLIRDVPYNVDPELISLSEGAPSTLAELQKAGYLLVVISNQAGIGLGYFKEKELDAAFNRISTLLENFDVKINGFYYCPHPATEACDCRKPAPGLITRAAKDLNIDLGRSWMIGDILNDVEAGARAGTETILLDIGNETEWKEGPFRKPGYIVKSWHEIARIIS